MLPPPAPFKIVVLAAAAFEMNFAHFLLAIFAGRFVRFLIEALLTLWFGPEIVTLAGSLFAHRFVWVLLAVGALVVGWLIWRRARRKSAEKSLENKNAAGKDSTLRSEETRLTS
jgi:membrane protein DedA with SNARE-associated domain